MTMPDQLFGDHPGKQTVQLCDIGLGQVKRSSLLELLLQTRERVNVGPKVLLETLIFLEQKQSFQ